MSDGACKGCNPVSRTRLSTYSELLATCSPWGAWLSLMSDGARKGCNPVSRTRLSTSSELLATCSLRDG
jgi:hypothetical protein